MQKLYEWVFASWVEIFALLISLGAIYYARVSAAAARDAVNEARRTNDIATEANTLTQQSIKIIREAPEAESKLLAIRETEKQIAVSISLALMKHEWERASQEMLTSYRIHATKLPDDLHERARRVSALLMKGSITVSLISSIADRNSPEHANAAAEMNEITQSLMSI